MPTALVYVHYSTTSEKEKILSNSNSSFLWAQTDREIKVLPGAMELHFMDAVKR